MYLIILIFTSLAAFIVAEEQNTILIDNIPRIKSKIDPKISEIKTRIIGGKPARTRQFPYQVGLQINNLPPKYRSWCGGSLISKNYVLTAAHCVYMPVYQQLPDGSASANPNLYDIVSSVDVYLGLVNKEVQESNRQIIHVTRYGIIMHAAYNRISIHNDIALLKLPQPAQLNKFVQLINLPKRSHNKNELFGRTVTSSGWGIYTGQQLSPVLRYADFGVVPYHQCSQYFNQIIDDKQICINRPTKSACMGDSGGPNVVSEANGEKTVIGITSYVSNYGCEVGWPTVLTRVSGYLDWIQQNTGIQVPY